MHFCCICKPKKNFEVWVSLLGCLKLSSSWSCLVCSVRSVKHRSTNQLISEIKCENKCRLSCETKCISRHLEHNSFNLPQWSIISPYPGRQFPRSTPCNVKSLQTHLVDSWWKMWNSLPWSYFLNILTTWKHCQRHYWSKVWMSASKFWPKFIFKI